MSNNPAVVDFQVDEKYQESLKERRLFVCADCNHEKPLIDRIGNICKKCADEFIVKCGGAQRCNDSAVWGK